MSGLSNFCVNLQSSFDFFYFIIFFYIFYILNISFCCFGWFVYFSTVIFFQSSSFHSLRNMTQAERTESFYSFVKLRKGMWVERTELHLRTVKGACKGQSA